VVEDAAAATLTIGTLITGDAKNIVC